MARCDQKNLVEGACEEAGEVGGGGGEGTPRGDHGESDGPWAGDGAETDAKS